MDGIYMLLNYPRLKNLINTVLIALLFLCSNQLLAQDQGFDFLGITVKELVKANQEKSQRTILPSALVTIYSDDTKLKDFKTDGKAEFNTRLPYGHMYKVYFSHPSAITGFILIDANIPKEKYNLQTGVQIESPLVDKKSVDTDTVKYRFAFDKYGYDGKKRLVRDEQYLQDFLSGKLHEYMEYKALLREQKRNAAAEPPKAAAEKFNYITGKILTGDAPGMPVKNVKVILVGDKGEPLQTCQSNNSGRFSFANVVLDQSYTLKVDETDLKLMVGQKITIINRNDKEVIITSADGKGSFKFRLLNSDKKTFAMLAAEEDDFMIAGNLLAIINNVTQPIANTKVQLTNAKGEMIEAVMTNEFGTFVFTKIPADQNFLIELAEGDPKLANIRVIITDRNGKEVNSTVCNSAGKFKFEFLKQDVMKFESMEVEETALRMDMKGKLAKNTAQQNMSNTKLDLVNERDQVVQSTSTDNAGNFKFSRVPYENNYSLNTPAQSIEKVILSDAKGVVIKEYKTGGVVNTIKMPLLSADLQKITSVSLDDPWLNIAVGNNNTTQQTVVIPEKVYFELNDFKITKEACVILDKVIQVMKVNPKIKMEVSSHTDSQGSDEYNLELSKKRAKSAVDYMIAHGIAKELASGVGYGETKLMNKCANGIACSEDEHAQNRRLEFKIMYIK
jgi:outer membrane protein OmpA-like peptidoglycan-associated protein